MTVLTFLFRMKAWEVELVQLLAVAAEKNWCDAFFFPFEKVSNFRPEMDAPMRVLTCLMNLKRSIFDEDEENLELAVLKMEKIPNEFLEVRELDILAGTSKKRQLQSQSLIASFQF